MSKTEPNGCLSTILGLVGIKLGEQAPSTDELPFRLGDDFLSPAELSFSAPSREVSGSVV